MKKRQKSPLAKKLDHIHKSIKRAIKKKDTRSVNHLSHKAGSALKEIHLEVSSES